MDENKEEVTIANYKNKSDADKARAAELNKVAAKYRLRSAKLEIIQHILMLFAIAVVIFVIITIGSR